MLVVAAIAVGIAGGLALVTRVRPPAPLPPPQDGGHVGGVVGGSTGDTAPQPQSKSSGPAQDGTLSDVSKGLHYASEALDLKKAANLVGEVLNATVVSEARTSEGKLTAEVGTAVTTGISAIVFGALLHAESIAAAFPPALAVVTAAAVVTAFVTQLVDIAVTYDRERQRAYLQVEIDALVAAGKCQEAWGLVKEARSRGIMQIGFMVGVPTWGETKNIVDAKYLAAEARAALGSAGASFFDAEAILVAAYAPAKAALAADLKLPRVKDASGQYVHPRTNRDAPAAVASRRIGDSWCEFIGSHTPTGFFAADDGTGHIIEKDDGLTPWQPWWMLKTHYGAIDPAEGAGKVIIKGVAHATNAGAKQSSTPNAAPGVSGGDAPTTSNANSSHVTSGDSSTGGGKSRETDL